MAKAQQALNEKMKELAAQPPVPPTTPAPPSLTPWRKPSSVQGAPQFPPLQPPPPAVSPEKQQLLDALLRQYQADLITPEQYQDQRAKILAGP